MESEPSLSAIEERLLLGQSEKDCASLESEMCALTNCDDVARMHGHFGAGNFQKMHIEKIVDDKMVQAGTFGVSVQECTTQTDLSVEIDVLVQLKEQVRSLEEGLSEKQAAYNKENSDLKVQCKDLESSLDLLKEEYDKCEDYWHEKLQEARESYEQDKADMDDRFQDLLLKIKEYDELLLTSPIANVANERLPPIEERASLERQVTDLEEECEVLRTELKSVKMEQDDVIVTYQRSFEVTFISF